MEPSRDFRAGLALTLSFALVFPNWVNPSPAHAASVIAAVWANDGGDKVTRDELRVSVGAKNVTNSVWDGATIKVFGGRNEVVNFNVVLESLQGAGGLSASFNSLTGPAGATIASQSATGNGVFDWTKRPIELFYVRYLQIKGLSRLSYDTYDERHVPQRLRRPWSGEGYASGTWQNRPDHDKFYPDIAVPLELVPTFAIAAGSNQSLWVDIFIPKGTPAGLYQGNFIVKQNGVQVQSVPVQLKVYNFSLPDTPSVKTMLYYSAANISHRYLGSTYVDPNSAAGAKARLLRDRHYQLAHRHRISLIGDAPGDCNSTADQPCPESVPRLDGSLFTAANGYDGPGVNTGNNVYSIGTYGSWNWQAGGQSAMNLHSDAWVNWFDQNAPGTDYFLYLIDESANTAQIETWAQSILKNPGPGQRLKSMATLPLPTAAAQAPSLDIPTSGNSFGITSLWQPLADRYTSDARKRFYMYNCGRPGSGSTATEDDGVALRERAWGQYKKKIQRWYFWETTYYNNYQGGRGETNLFQTAQTFGGSSSVDPVVGQTGWNYSNGDGVLFYPGTDQLYPSDSYGVDGPLASLRLKYWRRGIEDGDYLTMAAAVNPTAVQALVNTMVPKVLWEYGVSDPNDPTWVRTDVSWSNNPDAWESARAKLADLIAPFQAGDTTPPTVPSTLYFNYPNTTTLRLYWGASTDNVAVAGYRLDLATDPGFLNAIPGYLNKDMGNTLSLNLSGLAPATTCYARARAYDAAGNISTNSVVAAMATLDVNFAALSSPAQVRLSSPTLSTLSLSWQPSPSTATISVAIYQVQVSTLSNFSDVAGQPWAGLYFSTPTQSAALTGLAAGTGFYVRVRANDSYGNSSNYSSAAFAATVSAADTTAPTLPAGLYFNYPNTTTLRLFWGASTDNVAVAGYRIDLATDPGFVNAVPGTLNKDMGNTLTVNLSALAPGTSYYARARAYDAAGNSSGNTPVAAISTLNANYAALSAPVSVALGNPVLNTLSFSWKPSQAAGSYTPFMYQVQLSTSPDFSDFAGNPWGGFYYPYPTLSVPLSGLLPGTLYYARVRANDVYGNTSNFTSAPGAMTADTIPPSIPSAVHFNYPNTTTLRFYWGASTDNVAVAGYRIDLATDSGFVSAVPGYLNKDMGNTLSVNLDNLQPGTTYYGRARAYDAAKNVSGNSAGAWLATLNANYAALSAPVGVTLGNPVLLTLSMSWMPSPAAGGFTPFMYQVQLSTNPAFSDLAGDPWSGFYYQYPTRSVVLSGLKTGTVYYARVRANDAYGNTSKYSSPAFAAAALPGSALSAFATSALEAVRVYPNPWRRDRHPGSPVTFDHIGLGSTVKLFTVAGHWVASLDSESGKASWNLTTAGGDNAASGLYLYLVTNAQGQTAHGMFAVIR